jgi:hypothetical protein
MSKSHETPETNGPSNESAAAASAASGPTQGASVAAWLTGRLPADWFTGPAEVTVDREEVAIVGRLAEPSLPAEAGDAERDEAIAGRITGFREDTRGRRIEIAREIERRFGRKVAWGVTCGSTRVLFTHLAVPVMTRLRQPDRRVLDTLVDAGVARSRSDALAWCVRLVGQHTGDWLDELRSAMSEVERVRATGPGPSSG